MGRPRIQYQEQSDPVRILKDMRDHTKKLAPGGIDDERALVRDFVNRYQKELHIPVIDSAKEQIILNMRFLFGMLPRSSPMRRNLVKVPSRNVRTKTFCELFDISESTVSRARHDSDDKALLPSLKSDPRAQKRARSSEEKKKLIESEWYDQCQESATRTLKLKRNSDEHEPVFFQAITDKAAYDRFVSKHGPIVCHSKFVNMKPWNIRP